MPRQPTTHPDRARARSQHSSANLATIDSLLARRYGNPTRHRGDPLDVLIGTILSQNTNDTNSSRAYDAMREAFPTWRDVMNADPAALEQALRPGGLARTKSRRIQQILRSIAAHGDLSLEPLRRLPADRAEQELLGFHGVGPKTARCVLLFAFGKDVFPIDTHIQRVLKRLGIVPAKMSIKQAHEYLAPLLSKGHALALHLNLIAHGRQTCHPRNPACDQCILARLCPCVNKEGVVGDHAKLVPRKEEAIMRADAGARSF